MEPRFPFYLRLLGLNFLVLQKIVSQTKQRIKKGVHGTSRLSFRGIVYFILILKCCVMDNYAHPLCLEFKI